MTRVVCAMSGGVDSSVAAATMVEEGFEVIGMTMRLYDTAAGARSRKGTCCSPAEIDLARRVCEQLGIPHYTVDERQAFEAGVIDDFAREYAAGRTPNPCARCNEHVKFAPLLRRARGLGAPILVTGHYAQVIDGQLHRGLDPSKDQSYFLFAMGRETLEQVRFPLGAATKNEVRARARALGLANADAPDSQELCFVPEGDHGAVVEARATQLGLDTERLEPGEIRSAAGEVLGTHRGIHRVTVGQRRGLGVSSTHPRYVLRVIADERAVVVGDAEALACTGVELGDLRRLADVPEQGSLTGEVQIRHRGQAHPATIAVDGDRAIVEFAAAVQAVAPGQAAVVYDGTQVVAGGWIERAR